MAEDVVAEEWLRRITVLCLLKLLRFVASKLVMKFPDANMLDLAAVAANFQTSVERIPPSLDFESWLEALWTSLVYHTRGSLEETTDLFGGLDLFHQLGTDVGRWHCQYMTERMRHIIQSLNVKLLSNPLDVKAQRINLESSLVSEFWKKYKILNRRKLKRDFRKLSNQNSQASQENSRVDFSSTDFQPVYHANARSSGRFKIDLFSKYRLYLGPDKFRTDFAELNDCFQRLKPTLNTFDLENYCLDYQRDDRHLCVILGELINQYVVDVEMKNMERLGSSIYLILHYMFGVKSTALQSKRWLIQNVELNQISDSIFVLKTKGESFEIPVFFFDGFGNYLEALKENGRPHVFEDSIVACPSNHFTAADRRVWPHSTLKQKLENLANSDCRDFRDALPYKKANNNFRSYVQWLHHFQTIGEKQLYCWFLLVFKGLF